MNHSHEFIAIPKLHVDKYLMKGRKENGGEEGKEKEWKRKKGKER